METNRSPELNGSIVIGEKNENIQDTRTGSPAGGKRDAGDIGRRRKCRRRLGSACRQWRPGGCAASAASGGCRTAGTGLCRAAGVCGPFGWRLEVQQAQQVQAEKT